MTNGASKPQRILVTGATGMVGGLLTVALARTGMMVRAASRQVPNAERVAEDPALEWVEFDFEKPQTFDAALHGVDRAFLIARPGDDHPDRTAAPLLQAMVRHGVKHVVALTAMGADLLVGSGMYRFETMVKTQMGPVTHTILRPNWFMQVFSTGALAGLLRHQHVLRLPAADAAVSYIDARDVAACASVALLDAKYANNGYTLTGGAALDCHEITRVIGRAIERDMRYVPIDDDEARRLLVSMGFAAPRVERLIGFYELVRRGFCAHVRPTVQSMLGRAPTAFSRFVTEHARAWR